MELEGVDVKVEEVECEDDDEEEQPALDLSRTKVIMEDMEDGVKTEPKVDEDDDEEDEVVRRSRPADTTTASLQAEISVAVVDPFHISRSLE